MAKLEAVDEGRGCLRLWRAEEMRHASQFVSQLLVQITSRQMLWVFSLVIGVPEPHFGRL